MALKYFTKKSYTSLSQMASDIRKELKSLCPIDSANIKWKRGVNGMRAVAVRSLMGSGTNTEDGQEFPILDISYGGDFKVVAHTFVDDKLNSVKVIDGANPPSKYAGLTDLGEVEVGEVALNGLDKINVYLVLQYNNGKYTQTITSSLPSVGNYGHVLLAYVYDDGTIYQKHISGVVYWGGRYWI